MNTTTPGRLLFAGCLYVALLAGASAASSKSNTVSMGDDTFAITRTASSGFNRDVDQLKAEAQEDAADYCKSAGKQMKVLSLTSVRPHFALGYAYAKIVFKALNAGDPELTAQAPVISTEATTPTGNLYNDLLKLDDLHKRGILTDKEFESEKKKVLARSQ